LPGDLEGSLSNDAKTNSSGKERVGVLELKEIGYKSDKEGKNYVNLQLSKEKHFLVRGK